MLLSLKYINHLRLMKRANGLMEQIADPENLRLAFWKAAKGKRCKAEVLAYGRELDRHVMALREQLLTGNVDVGKYHLFKIFDPKERLICAASFPERVLHHALMNVCHDYFEKKQIYDSYATRKGKGQYAAIDRAEKYHARYEWFLKLDVRHYFDSINHRTLIRLLERVFKESRLLDIFIQIIQSYHTSEGHGLPIGNLTSQYFANFYLCEIDHWLKERNGVKAYVRYMDDMVLWSNNRWFLLRMEQQLREKLLSERELVIKPACLNKRNKGLPFLGYVLHQDHISLSRRSKERFLSKAGKYEKYLVSNLWTEHEYQRHILPLLAFVRKADTFHFRQTRFLNSV